VKLWDAQTGQESLSLLGHSHWVLSISFRADGKQIATASADKTVKLWDAHSGQEIPSHGDHSHWVNSVSFRPDGKRFTSASEDHTIKVWLVPQRR